MIRITDAITIEEREVDESFVRAAGPGGQNVNKVATAVQLRFDIRRSPSLPDDVRRQHPSAAIRIPCACSCRTGRPPYSNPAFCKPSAM